MIKRLGGTELLHCAVQHGDVVYLSGVTADDRSLGMAGQTTQVLDKIAKWLSHFGSDRSNMLSASIYLADMAKKDEMNQAWGQWFEREHLPTRATIGSSDLGAGVLIEIVVTAAAKA
jgi:enamine deaminase RidA (YjgF/YER057c/UK114 family)